MRPKARVPPRVAAASSSSRPRLPRWFLLLVSVSAASCCVLAARSAALWAPRRPRVGRQAPWATTANATVARTEWALAPGRNGVGSVADTVQPDGGIPRIIHQSWKSRERIPSRFAPWMRSWVRLHPGWTYAFWTDADNLALFERRYPQYLSVARAVSKISLADMARYALLHSLGGLYVDVDFECTRPFDALHRAHRLFLGSEPLAHAALLEKSASPALCNAIMASTPGHPFWLSVLDRIADNFVRRGRKEPNALDAVGLTGPRVVKQTYEGNASYEADETLAVLPPEFFYPEVAYWNLAEMDKACRRRQRLGGGAGASELRAAAERACEWLAAFPNGQFTPNTHATHHWQCTWCRGEQSPEFEALDAILDAARVTRPAISEDKVELVTDTR